MLPQAAGLSRNELNILGRVAQVITRYNMLAPGQVIGVGVSGGADSVALLLILARLAPQWNLRLKVLHLHHGLRGAEADADEMFVRSLAERFGLPCIVRRVDVRSRAGERGQNLEAAAREARREFFKELVDAGDVDRVAVGHTLNDQAETVLLRLLRGAGPGGLAAIRPVTREGIVRPLLGLRREEVREYLRSQGQSWREDRSNWDLNLARNRIRHQLLPQLEREWNPNVAELLAQLAMIALDEEEFWGKHIQRLADECCLVEDSAVLLRSEQLRKLSVAEARRLLRWALERARGDLKRIEFEHLERLLRLVVEEPAGEVVVPGARAVLSCGWVRVGAVGDWPRAEPYRVEIGFEGRWVIPVWDTELETRLVKVDNWSYLFENSAYNGGWSFLDCDRVGQRLWLTNWRPGARFRPRGHHKEKKLKELFQRHRVPCWLRESWPMVINERDEVVWTRKFGAAEPVAASADSLRVLAIREVGAPAWLNQILSGSRLHQ